MCMYACMHMCIYVCIYVCVYMYVPALNASPSTIFTLNRHLLTDVTGKKNSTNGLQSRRKKISCNR